MMRVVRSTPTRSRLQLDRFWSDRAVRVERLGLLAATFVVAFGLVLAFNEQTSEFASIRASIASGQVVDLNGLKSRTSSGFSL